MSRYLVVLTVFNICLELPNDSEKYFNLELTSFPILCILRNRDVSDTRPASQKRPEFGENFSFKRPGSIRSLFRSTRRFKRPICLVVDEFPMGSITHLVHFKPRNVVVWLIRCGLTPHNQPTDPLI